MFELTKEEIGNWRSQFVTSKSERNESFRDLTVYKNAFELQESARHVQHEPPQRLTWLEQIADVVGDKKV